jgi:hypothetical protein
MPNCEIQIDEDWSGPSILELSSIMEEIEDDRPVKVSWSNTRNEIAALRKFPNRKFILVVDNFPAKDRVTAVLGLPLSPPQGALDRAKDSLVELKTYDWRNFCDSGGKNPNPKYLLLKLVADSLRKGNVPALAEIMSPLLLDGIDVVDVDVLLRLKSRR